MTTSTATPDGSAVAIERFVVFVISLTAVLTAWTTFQSAKWSGEQLTAISQATATRAEAESWFNDAREQYIVDVQMFNAWLEATLVGNDELADSLEDRFPETLEEAFDQWTATSPLTSASAPLTPLDEYDYPDDGRGEALEVEAEELQEDALAYNQRSDNYTAMAILFATVILFAALSDKIPGAQSRRILVALASTGLLAGILIVATFPVKL